MLLKEIVNNEAIHEEFEIEDHDDSDEEDKDEKAILLKRQKKAELMLARKYKNIRKAIEDDLLLFQDDIFSIEPQQGQIWPNSEMTITLTFVPKGALQYSCIAFCNISCSEERLALNLAGEGIGPKAFLSQTDLPIGNKNVNEKERYQITIENRGEIECKYELLPNERNFGKMFKFHVTKGTLEVGNRQTIEIEFCSTIPGEFKETFRFRLEGSTDLLSLTCFGHVTAPKFSFDIDQINFGKVSYSFPVQSKIRLKN